MVPAVAEEPRKLCDAMAAQQQRSQAWLSGVQDISQGRAANVTGSRDASVFSAFLFEDSCQPGSAIAAPIEPLVGHLRYAPAGWREAIPCWGLGNCAVQHVRCGTWHVRCGMRLSL